MYTLFFGEKRAHFLAMPRTASKACRDAMRRLGAVAQGGHHDISTYSTVVQDGDLVMSTVRNPFDWFVSFWFLNGCPGDFDRYVPKLCRESEWIRRNPGCTKCELFWKYAPLATHVLRYENIAHEFTEAMETHGFPPITLHQAGAKKPKPYTTYYNPGTIQYIQSRFSEELARYGYQF